MKRVIIVLLLAALLAGCAAHVSQENPAESPSALSDTPADTPSPLPVEETPSPSPVSIEEVQAVYRGQGCGAVLAMLPQEYLTGIPQGEIVDAHARLAVGDQTYSVWLGWDTDRSVSDAVSVLEQNLGCAYELDEGTYKCQIADRITGSVRGSEGGIQISFHLPVTGETELSWLIDSFPFDYFELPDTLDVKDAVHREVNPLFVEEMSAWRWSYTLSWEYDKEEGEALASTLPAFYGDKDGYTEGQEGARQHIAYQTGGDEVNIQWYEQEDRFHIDATYTYHEPSHLDSPLVWEVLADPAAALLADLPEAYQGLLGQTSLNFSVTYIPGNAELCYTLYSPAGADPAAFAAGAGALLGGEFVDNGHGGYDLSTQEVSAQIKTHGEELCLEIVIAVPEGYASPYIQDIYPAEYEPLGLDDLLGTPHSVGTGCYLGNEYKSLEFFKVWYMDEEQGMAAYQEIEAALLGLHNFHSGRDGDAYSLRCAIREHYDFVCRLEDKGEFWRFSIALIANIE